MFLLTNFLSFIILRISDIIHSFLDILFVYPNIFSTALWILFLMYIGLLIFYILIFIMLLSNLICLSSSFFSIVSLYRFSISREEISYILLLFLFMTRCPELYLSEVYNLILCLHLHTRPLF